MWVERKCTKQYNYVSLVDLWMSFSFVKLCLIDGKYHLIKCSGNRAGQGG